MLVETYEVEEMINGREGQEIEAEALALIDTLGLEGQQRLVRTLAAEDGTEVVQRIPYREMLPEEIGVYGVLCPQRTAVEMYEAGSMPVRVLQVVAHARPLFAKVEVWHPVTQVKDPILVGVGEAEYDWNAKRYLLARWGEELAPLEELRERAATTLRARWERECRVKLGEVERFLAALDTRVEEALGGQTVYSPA